MKLNQLLEGPQRDRYMRQLLMRLAEVAHHPFKKDLSVWASEPTSWEQDEKLTIFVNPTIWGAVVQVNSDDPHDAARVQVAIHRLWSDGRAEADRLKPAHRLEPWKFALQLGDKTLKKHSNVVWNKADKYTITFPKAT